VVTTPVDALWLADSNTIMLQVALDMVHAATCLTTLGKVEDCSTFAATCNATFCCIAGCENGVLHMQFFCNLQCNVGCVASCRKNCIMLHGHNFYHAQFAKAYAISM